MEINEMIKEEMKRFQQIIEYTTVRKGLVDEAEPSPEEEPQGEMSEPGGEQPDMGQMPQQGGPQGFNPQEPQDAELGGEDGGMGVPEMDDSIQPDDEVVDISELTDSQDETNSKVDKINDKFVKVLKYISNFEEMIKSNDEKINDLKKEFEKRNPTQLEKLSMQTANSYPFNITPNDYWKNKEKTSNYRTESDDNGVEQAQYTITKDDIDGALDWKTISDSLSDFDPYHQTMKNTMF